MRLIAPKAQVIARSAQTTLRRRVPIWIVVLSLVLGAGLVGVTVVVYNHVAPKTPPVGDDPGGDPDPPIALSDEEEQRLLDAYAPVLVLPFGEVWRPLPVDAFLADACLSPSEGGGHRPCLTPDSPAAAELPHGAGWRLDLATCAIANGPECYEDDAAAQGAQPAVAYGRVWRNTSGIHPAIGYVVQYWFFYYFDDWQNVLTEPTIWQFHEGDWEQVSVALTRDRQPLYVAASGHCTGRLRYWEALELRGDSHPTIYVARGSHANYFAPGSYPSPKKCFPSWARTLIKRLRIDPRDTAGAGLVLGHGGKQPLTVHAVEEAPWLHFQGRWGEGEFLRWESRDGATHRRALGPSPTGPAQRRPHWPHPVLATIDWPNDKTSGP